MLPLRPLLAIAALVAPCLAIWPMPSQITQGTTGLKLSSSFKVTYSGALAHGAPADLTAAGRSQNVANFLVKYIVNALIYS